MPGIGGKVCFGLGSQSVSQSVSQSAGGQTGRRAARKYIYSTHDRVSPIGVEPAL